MPGLGPLASSAQAGDLRQAQADKPSIDNHPPDKQSFIKTQQGSESRIVQDLKTTPNICTQDKEPQHT